MISQTAAECWAGLAPPWHAAFDEAWRSFVDGNLGIGAVLVDPDSGEIVSRGRNRVAERSAEPHTISGNFMAHAEMNAFAAMERFKADGLHLYTTLEPCLMCSATTVFLHVERVHFAATDEFFPGLGDLWEQHPYSQRHRPESAGPLDGPLRLFARTLPLSREAYGRPDGPVMAVARRDAPIAAAAAVDVARSGALLDTATADGTTRDALEAAWPLLVAAMERPA